MQHQLNTHAFQNKDVRTLIDEKGEPHWVAKDVAEALGYRWQKNLVAHVPSEWRGVNPINTPGGDQAMVTLSEPGLFFFLNRSDKPAALPMQKWVAGEVLPSIRKTGAYSIPKKRGANIKISLTAALTRDLIRLLGVEGARGYLERKDPDFCDLPGTRPKDPQQVVAPTLGLTEPIQLELRVK